MRAGVFLEEFVDLWRTSESTAHNTRDIRFSVTQGQDASYVDLLDSKIACYAAKLKQKPVSRCAQYMTMYTSKYENTFHQSCSVCRAG